MMKITVKDFEKIEGKISALEKALNGGKGSGNFGHAGRPGKVGGSSTSGTAVSGDGTKALDDQIAKARRELASIQEDVTAEMEFGGDISHLASLEQDARAELARLLREKKARERTQEKPQKSAQKDSRASKQAAYEQAVREYESEMGSLNRQIDQYEKENRTLEDSIRDLDNPSAEKSTANLIEENNRKIEDLKEQGRNAITKMAAKSAQYHYGVGKITKEFMLGWSVTLGDTTIGNTYKSHVERFQDGAASSYKASAVDETTPYRDASGNYDVVYKGTITEVGYTDAIYEKAYAYSTGWNAAAKLTKEIRDNLLETMPRYR